MKRREIWVKISIRPNMVIEMKLARAFTKEKREEGGREEKRSRFGI